MLVNILLNFIILDCKISISKLYIKVGAVMTKWSKRIITYVLIVIVGQILNSLNTQCQTQLDWQYVDLAIPKIVVVF